jgi:hypothetical protein
MTSINKVEFGDYQTPEDFCLKVCDLLISKYSLNPKYVIEPTMGVGNFLKAASLKMTPKLLGIEINHEYVEKAKKSIKNSIIFESNIFTFDFQLLKDELTEGSKSKVLFLGNPPWVTNSSLSSLGSYNLPYKDNFKKEKGFDAVTGKGNFDICEYILLQLMSEFENYSDCYLAFLCKEIVAKNIIRDLHKYSFGLEFADLYSFDANKIFGVSCDAVLFVTKLNLNSPLKFASVYSFDDPFTVKSKFGWNNEVFVSDIESYSEEFDGKCQIMWRQGLKHDCSKVMELKNKNGTWVNGYGENIDFIDSEFVHPLVKSSAFKQPIINSFEKMVIVTQRFVREDTERLKNDMRVFGYLSSHSSDFEKRKSIIYKNTPPFSIFGIGDYSFVDYKIGLSGFYKEPKFSFLHSTKKPVMVDDTCYFIGTNNKLFAEILFCALDEQEVYSFLKSISFKNSKRPFTKDVMQRLDLIKILNHFGYYKIQEKVNKLFNDSVSKELFDELLNKLSVCNGNLDDNSLLN